MLSKLLYPFTFVLSRLKYAQKFILISVLFAAPLALLFSLWIAGTQEEISSSLLEKKGLAQVEASLPFVLSLQQHRGQANAYLNGGGADSETKLAEAALQADNDAALIDKALQNAELAGSGAEWKEIFGEWKTLQQQTSSLSAEDSFSRHSELIGRMLDFVIKSADESGLSLDTEIDSFYLMDMVVKRLPSLIEETAQIRGTGNGMLTKRQAKPEALTDVAVKKAQAENNLKELNKALARLGELNPEAGAKIEASGNQSADSIETFLTLVQQRLFDDKSLSSEPAEFFAAGTSTIEVSYSFFGEASSTLALLLDQRIDRLETQRNLIVSTIAVALLLVLLFYAAFYRSVHSAVSLLSERSAAMAEGDLSRTIALETRDELGQVGDSFNRMIAALNKTLLGAQGASERSAESSQQLSSVSTESSLAMRQVAEAVQSVAEGSEMQRRMTEDTALAMNEMAIGISRIAESSASVAESAAETAQRADAGDRELSAAVEQMRSIRESVSLSTGSVSRLDEHSRQIDDIVASIKAIARQTQLLSLNANIEAARAGEHGRGFAVVASEVGKLAEQTQSSVETISLRIGDIRGLIGETVELMQRTDSETTYGMTFIDRASSAIGEIGQSARSVNDQIQEISAASEEISAGVEEVTASVSEVARVAQHSSEESQNMAAAAQQQLAALEEIGSAAGALSDMAGGLQSDLKFFKLSSGQ
ncbi:methyl-accepting chemotaxis protein [Saccharibacillus alkalitolerans]|uniref:Methyl-accepting chemotaxis protein n=1 Tax=Saccharibacillus alkalitolerans TaxID=2705290 RepID=A0ABX0FDH7_9BACL|nr:HAMP domain-containing methyl-accepting chemotaxis protein [Saccharibacillus alkalitolerans]NGZ77774.1 methyl-accepting chemotaxis protein [Saccharibacillus alkalitolerans]